MNNFQHPYGKVNNATIDFMTFTTKANNDQNQALLDWWQIMQQEANAAGEEIKAMAPQGYHGWKTKHLFYGVQQKGWWWIASSEIADKVARELIVMRPIMNVTRLDLQVTILTEEPWKDFASFMRDLVRANEAMDNQRKRITIDLFESDGKGDTCYVGSKGSARRLTIYDKTAEQKFKIPGNQYRFEIRLKHQQASEVWPMICEAADLRYLCMSIVSGALLNAGLPVPWEENTEPVGLPSTYRTTNQERVTNWILNQVVPAYKRVTDPDLQERIRLAFGF
jgi:hypothetical protein